jgi:hypothetical protein
MTPIGVHKAIWLCPLLWPRASTILLLPKRFRRLGLCLNHLNWATIGFALVAEFRWKSFTQPTTSGAQSATAASRHLYTSSSSFTPIVQMMVAIGYEIK